jgi:hypothetical protein
MSRKFSFKSLFCLLFLLIIFLFTNCQPPTAPPPPPLTGTIHYDNWTSYSINCYLDSAYVGNMPAMGSYYQYNVTVGSHTLYAVSAGGTVYWGPSTITLTTSGFDWNLY